MKKITLSISMILLSVLLFLVSNVYATTVNFDPEGGGEYTEFELFQLNSYGNIYEFTESADFVEGSDGVDKSEGDTATGHFFSKTHEETGVLEEHFTVRMTEGQDVYGDYVGFQNLFMDLDIYGDVDEADNTVSFSDGGAEMYFKDGSDYQTIATLDFKSALVTQLQGSVIGDAGLGMKADFTFSFTDVTHPEYFGATENELAGKEWLLALSGGSMDVENVWYDDTYYINQWQYPGTQVEFAAVPEPTTLLLFGTGLLGMAAFGRRKFMKKS